MLIEFSVENFLSFKEKTTFSMLPHNSYKELLEANTTKISENRLSRVLNSAVVFGPNASGKTNFIKAINFLKAKLLGPLNAKLNETDLKFGFDKSYKEKPTSFSVKFSIEGVIYDYDFSVQNGNIIYERLDSLDNQPKKQWKLLFERSRKLKDGVQFGNSLRGEKQSIYSKTKPETLFLRSLYEWNNQDVKNAYSWIEHDLIVFENSSNLERAGIYYTLNEYISGGKSTGKIEKLIRNADFGIEKIDVDAKEFELSDSKVENNGYVISNAFPGILYDGKSSKLWDAHFTHKAIDETGMEKYLRLNHRHEALGTKKLFALSAAIIDIIETGQTLCIDELTNSMHPMLTEAIIKLFHDPEINTNGAQLIFNTHDVYFLNKSIFRRDQIWFANKNKYGATDLTGLHDYKVRNDDAIGAKYLMGAYDAIPIISYKDLIQVEEKSSGAEKKG